MTLTIEAIKNAANDEILFDLLSSELQRLVPEDVRVDDDRYHDALPNLPRGFRAMAGIHFLDVSMALDDLAWHFGNQNDERDLRETLNGLRELEMFEFAKYFEQMWEFMKPHMPALQTGDYGGKDFHDWLKDIGAQELADPMNREIWGYCDEHDDYRLLTGWLHYARKYPERCVLTEGEA